MSETKMILAACRVGHPATSRAEVITAIAALIADALGQSEAKIRELLEKRESVGSTGLQNGIAVPHCGIPDAESFTIGIVVTKAAVDFGAIDGKESDIFAFVAGPEQNRTEHVRIIAGLIARLRDETTRRLIRTLSTNDELQRVVRESLVPEADKKPDRFSLVTVYVQNETLYESIVEAISSESGASVAVSSMQSAGAVLHRMPLFAMFWGDHESREIHRVEAILPQDQTNRTIRRIEDLTGPQPGVQISVMDLSYGSGRLDL